MFLALWKSIVFDLLFTGYRAFCFGKRTRYVSEIWNDRIAKRFNALRSGQPGLRPVIMTRSLRAHLLVWARRAITLRSAYVYIFWLFYCSSHSVVVKSCSDTTRDNAAFQLRKSRHWNSNWRVRDNGEGRGNGNIIEARATQQLKWKPFTIAKTHVQPNRKNKNLNNPFEINLNRV